VAVERETIVDVNYQLMELVTLNEIGKVVNSTLELHDVLDEIVRLTTVRMSADACAVFLLENQELVLRGARGLNMNAVNNVRLPLGEGITGAAAKVGKPLAQKNLNDNDQIAASENLGDEEYVSMLAVPLIARGRILGVINIYTRTSREFLPRTIHFLSSIATLIAGAIRNSQLYNRAKHSVEELTALNRISRDLNESLDPEKTISVTLRSSLEITQSDGALMRLRQKEGAGDDLSSIAVYRTDDKPTPEGVEDVEAGIASLAMAQGYPQIETHKLPGFCEESCHILSMPMEIQGKVEGTVSVYRLSSQDLQYTSEERRLLGTVLSHAATSIENAHLFESVNRAEQELRQAQNRLMLQEKLAALGEMAAAVAHELRNPLVSIGGYARRILKYLKDTKKVSEYVGIITREVERLETLANDILNYVKPRTPRLATVNIVDILKNVSEMQSELLVNKGNVRFVQEISPNAQKVWADSEHLETALLDLFQNAVEAIENGDGIITVCTEPVPDDTDRICITVKDSGKGIPEENLSRVFTPFFTTKPKGSGLGLATTKNVIDAHEGSIELESIVDVGTTFRITLLRPPQERKVQNNEQEIS